MSFASPSPSTPSSSHEDMDPTHEAGPSRKRPRPSSSSTPATSEERKEARAHRNRIAAQNSRDRRKAQFSYLERRVKELEEENAALKAGFLGSSPPLAVSLPPLPVMNAEEALKRAEIELARERENAELKERIKTLERGWDAVVKALAAQGLPMGLGNSTTAPETTKPTSPPPNTAFGIPSPAPSYASLDTDAPSTTTLPSSSPSSLPTFVPTTSTSPSSPSPSSTISTTPPSTSLSTTSTRHLAAGGFGFELALDRGSGSNLPSSLEPIVQVDTENADKTMERLFEEIFVDVEAQQGGVEKVKEASGSDKEGEGNDNNSNNEGEEKKESETSLSIEQWTHEIEMQRMLDLIQGAMSSTQEPVSPDMSMDPYMDLSMGMEFNVDLALAAGWDVPMVESGTDVF